MPYCAYTNGRPEILNCPWQSVNQELISRTAYSCRIIIKPTGRVGNDDDQVGKNAPRQKKKNETAECLALELGRK